MISQWNTISFECTPENTEVSCRERGCITLFETSLNVSPNATLMSFSFGLRAAGMRLYTRLVL